MCCLVVCVGACKCIRVQIVMLTCACVECCCYVVVLLLVLLCDVDVGVVC